MLDYVKLDLYRLYIFFVDAFTKKKRKNKRKKMKMRRRRRR